MRILSLESSARAASAAVTEDGRLLAQSWQCTGLTHSRTLMPMVQDMLRNAEIPLASCDAVAVAAGPGSFTGIRIGVAAAKGLAFAMDRPAAGVSTLEAMARGAACMDGLLVCAMDARRAQVYNALFDARDGRLTRLTPDRAISLEDLAAELEKSEKKKILVGDGAQLCYTGLLEKGIACTLAPPHLLFQSAAGVGFAAEELARSGGLVPARDLAPVYLRATQAERVRNERRKKEQST